MKKRICIWLASVCCGLFTACAVITINVYFPEKAAKEAYKSLDDMMLKNPAVSPDKKPAGEQPAAPPETRPQSLLRLLPSISLVASAHAAEDVGDELAVEVAGMPEVTRAYEEMSRRLPVLTALFNSGAVGLTNQGLVTVRDKSRVTPADETLLAAENGSRKVVVGAMARAILKVTRQEETRESRSQVLARAAATFAEARREAARPGWWVQGQNGRWLQK